MYSLEERYQELLAVQQKWVRDHPGELSATSQRIQREKEQQRRILEEKRKTLESFREKAIKILNRPGRGPHQEMILSPEDKSNWWNTLKTRYPKNYEAAVKYYHEKDKALEIIGIDKIKFTINEYFELYGLPRIWTDENHEIKISQ